MGFFDDLVKLADKGLTAVENGALEKGMVAGLDKLDASLGNAIDSAEKAAARPEELLEKAEQAAEKVEQKARALKERAAGAIDAIHKSD